MIVVASIGLALATSTAEAGEYLSGFGFAISVPDVYLVLTRAEVQQNAALFLDPDAAEGVGEIPGTMRQEVYRRVEAGELEIFYRTAGFDRSFVDNVNVMIQQAELPNGPTQLEAVCRLLPGEFSRLFGRPVGLDGCEMRSVAGRPALYLFFDGALPGTKTLQYQIQRGAGETLILTATAADTNISRMMGEFESMVASIRAR
jgi:hypothetical protein